MKILTNSDCYQTDENAAGGLARKMPALFFYASMIGVVLKSSRQAKGGRYDGEAWVEASYDIVKGLEKVGARFHIDHFDRFKNVDGPCVFVANHMSTLEAFTLPCLIHPFKPANFVVKESLFHYPVFKHVMHALQPIRVGRVNPREDLKTMMTEGLKNLKAGVSMIIFPQNTRMQTFDPSQFNSIGTKIASRAGVPVVPVAVRTDAWDNGKIVKDFGPIRTERPIHFTFGNPISVSGNGREAQAEVVAFIERHLNQWFEEEVS